jgi:hypothetical protein
VAKVTKRPGANGFSDLEQKFFEGAPPEVAIAPPPPPSFDDLDAGLPERRRVRRTAPRPVAAAPEREGRAILPGARAAIVARLARVRAALERVRPALARVRPALARMRPALARVRPALERVRPALERLRPGLRSALSRFLEGLPGERPDGRTVLATLAVVVVVCGLSATVLGHASPWHAPAAAPAVETAR